MANVRQTNFSGGELAPELCGRTDLPVFGRAARTLLNFFVSQRGAAVSRPGTARVATTKAATAIRLVPFVYSDTQSYVLEIGNGYVRFHRDGGPLLATVLPYDTQTVNFTVGQTITGLTSGATARITGDTDAGASGTLQLDAVVGTFQNNEVLRESFDGEYLAFDAQAANFTVGLTVTGGTSGATGVIASQVDAGATGVLRLIGVVGTFVNNEALIDSAAGAAVVNLERALVNGAPSLVPYEIVAPWAYADLNKLQWAQTGDILTITHPSYAPRELRRYGDAYWTLPLVSFAQVTPYFRDVGSPYTATLRPEPLEPLPVEDIPNGKPAREWVWKCTEVVQDTATGRVFETLGLTTVNSWNAGGGVENALPATIAVYPSRPVTLLRPVPAYAITIPSGWNTYKVLAINIYRGRGELFGFVGQTTTRTFIDVGAEPDYTVQPPKGTNPFEVYNVAGVLTRTEEPSAVAFFQERRVFAGTDERPDTLFFSATGDYFNFDERTYSHVASEALVYALAARRRENIRSIVSSLSHLLVFTSASVWTFAGAQGAPLGFDSVDAKLVDEVGANYLHPLVVEGMALYARAKGSGVRGLAFQNERGGFVGVDLSSNSHHLFLGPDNELVDWCYAEDPWALVWVVRADGSLLSFTFNQQEQVWCWARHATNGVVKAICAVPEGDEDAVYVVVQRTINGLTAQYVERMTSRVQLGTTSDDICLDCAVTVTQGAPALAVTGLSALEGCSVYVIGKGNPVQGPYVVAAGAITLGALPIANSGANAVLHVGLVFTCDLETLDLASTDVRTRQKTVREVGIEVSSSKGLFAGPDLEHLVEWRQRSVADSYAAIGNASELVRVPVRGEWNPLGRAAVRQSLPLPVTIVGITREVEIGG